MKQSTDPRSKLMHLESINNWQRGKNIQLGQDSLFSKWYWEYWTVMFKNKEINKTWPPSYTIHKNKLKIDKKNLNKSCKTIKILEENIRSKISSISPSNVPPTPDMSPRARETKGKINKWDYIKLKSYTEKQTITKSKGNPLYGRTYLPVIHLMRG